MNEIQSKIVRRQFDRGFKVDAVRLVTEGGQRVSDVARQVGVTPKMLSQWRTQLDKHATPEQAFVGPGNDREAEVKQLKRRIALLEMERDILPKPSASLRSPKGNHKDAFQLDFSVAPAESAVACEAVVPSFRRLSQRLCALLQAPKQFLLHFSAQRCSVERCSVERHRTLAAHPGRLSPGALLFG